MDINERRAYLVNQINAHKASILDHQKAIDAAENVLFGLHGALETVDAVIRMEQQKTASQQSTSG